MNQICFGGGGGEAECLYNYKLHANVLKFGHTYWVYWSCVHELDSSSHEVVSNSQHHFVNFNYGSVSL